MPSPRHAEVLVPFDPPDSPTDELDPLAQADFLSLLSHELRTPLQGLSLLNDLMLTRVNGSADEVPAEWLLERLHRSRVLIEDLHRTMEMLLSIGRLRDGRLALNREALDLGQLFEHVAARMQPRIDHGGCDLLVETEGSLEGAWDRVLVETVLSNLLSNAVKFGAGHPIEVTLRGSATEVELAVRDHGPGVPAGQEELLFQRFSRLPQTARTPGLGLGLWIARSLTEALGGRIALDLRNAPGARFVVTLPR